MNRPRLIFAIVSTAIEEALFVVAVFWGLPQLDIQVPVWLLILLMAGWLFYSVYTYRKGTSALKVGHIIGMQSMVGSKGKTVERLDPEGWVKIRGELWKAKTVSGRIEPDTEIIVTGQNRLKLEVKPQSSSGESPTS